MRAGKRPGRAERVLWWCLGALVLQVCTAAPDGTTAVLRGRIASASSCGSSSSRAARVSAAIEGNLGPEFATHPVYCAFPPWSLLQQANASGLLTEGQYSSTTPELASVLDTILGSTTSNATLSPLVVLKHHTSSTQYAVKCSSTIDSSDAALVLFTKEAAGQGQDLLAMVLPEEALDRLDVTAISPPLGPSSGGTDILIQGAGLRAPLACIFSSKTATKTVSARVTSSTAAVCTAPQWGLGLTAAEPTMLTVTSGGCSSAWSFQYYRPPAVTRVSPPQLPRYGSFLVTATLNASLADMAGSKMDSLEPLIKLSGAEPEGGDLVLPANLTADGLGLEAWTPDFLGPLAAGKHELSVSLNGQRFSGGDATTTPKLTLQGPLVAMSQQYYHRQEGSTSVTVTATLQGPTVGPVSADLRVESRGASSSPRISGGSLEWAAGEVGERSVRVDFGGGSSQMTDGAAVVSLVDVSGGDMAAPNATSIVSGLAAAQLTVGFSIVPNQVAYRGDNASVPIRISNAALRVPAAVGYRIKLASGATPSYISAAEASGYLEWDTDAGDEMLLEVPLDWANVSYETEDHLLVTLTPAWNARVLSLASDVGLHVFGVERGQCPPGTFRFDASPAMSQLPAWTAPVGAPPPSGASAWLRSIGVLADGWALDLSTRFDPEVPEYGVIVPPTAATAQLCLHPYKEGARITVEDSQGVFMTEATGPGGTEPGAAFASAGRRLQGKSSVVAAPSQAQSAGAGVLPLGSQEPQAAAACDGRTWSLPLSAGQNEFKITVSPAAPVVWRQALPAPPKPAWLQSPLQAAGGSYTLSVVRLADPTHAQLSMLNVSDSDASYSVCVGDPEGDTGDWETPLCKPDEALRLNVSAEADWVSVHPGLRYPGVQGLRVEVAGQVLSQGGNIGADQLADTADVDTVRSNADFLPVALVVGLPPGTPVEVPIVVVAEDGVTSLRYYVHVTRTAGNASSPASSPSDDGSALEEAGITLAAADTNTDSAIPPPLPPAASAEPRWPVAPSREPWCTVCPAGWSATLPDQGQCDMCMPGTYAPMPQTPSCLACSAGTYTNSWGSTHCNHCIIGTYSPRSGSRLCLMCPENMTNPEDGSSSCPMPLQPGTNLTMRYAVIVSFGVFLNGTSLEDIATKVGVNASSKLILERLVRSDTATAFNITAADVNVTGITQVERRLLLVNVTATLGVDLPTNSSQDDVATQLAVKNLSADDAIDMLASQPDKFLGRTTKALDVTAEPGSVPPTRTESHPPGVGSGDLLPWYAIMLLCGGVVLLLASGAVAYKRRARLRPLAARLWSPAGRRLPDAADESAGDSADAPARPPSGAFVARRSRPHDRQPIFQGLDSALAEQ